jgi:hypothetical protein
MMRDMMESIFEYLQLLSLTISIDDESSSGFETSITMALIVDNPKNTFETLHNVDPTQDISALWAQRIEEEINDLTKNQTLMMKNITNLERA